MTASIALLTLLQIVGTLVLLSRAATIIPTASDGGDSSKKLNMLTVTAEKIEGMFLTPNRGIHFLSEAYGDSHRLSVVTIYGDPILFAERKDRSATFVSVVEKDFLLVNKLRASRTVDDYIVPRTLSQQVKSAVKGRRITQKLLRHLDRSGVNATRDNAFKELLMGPEVELIVAAAKALGSTGLHGRGNPAAMTFYALAKQLAMAKMQEVGSLLGEGGESGYGEPLSQHYQRRERRSPEFCANIPRGFFLFPNDRFCPRDECPVGDTCLGMCGPSCTMCWDWGFICDDCCFHRGCYDHDLCCKRDFFSWSCLIPFGFDCDGFDCSQRCDPNPCLNGGTCIEEAGSFRCNCTNQFTGSICRLKRRWCVPDPCQNGGTCTEEADNFTCTCPPQFTGDTCEQAVGCIPNPCQNGGTCTEGLSELNCTIVSNCTEARSKFNCTEGSNCTHEQSGFNCTELHSGFTCTCPSNYIGIQCEQFDNCYSNPCQNGGHCLLLSNGYWCNCEESEGAGLNCEHRVGNLRIYARGGTGLPDEDGWLNDSDPYLEVIAYDYLGNSLRKRTDDDSGDESPEWNEWLNFGSRAWKRFTVKVWDEDVIYDDALSSSQTFYLNDSFPIQRTFVRHNAYSGYVWFDYYFQ